MRKIIITAILFAGTIPAFAQTQVPTTPTPLIETFTSSQYWDGPALSSLQCEFDNSATKVRNCQLLGGMTLTEVAQYFLDGQDREYEEQMKEEKILRDGWGQCVNAEIQALRILRSLDKTATPNKWSGKSSQADPWKIVPHPTPVKKSETTKPKEKP
jgi:hypothetical protein